MDGQSLANYDLNLLRYLRCLVEEASVSRAAERMGVTQPAMSASLRRLRATFADPILVRSGRSMTPTPRAVEMVAVVAPLLDTANALQAGNAPFAPATSRRSFTLMGSDYIEFAFLPKLCSRIEQLAPGITLVQRPANPREASGWMQSGLVDLGIGILEAPSPTLRTRAFMSEDLVCVVRKGHAATRGGFTAAAYAALSHVVVAPGGAGYLGRPIDEALHALGLSRRIALMLPSYLAVPYIIASTHYIATVPRHAAQTYAVRHQLQIIEPPVRLPAFRLAMFWHERVATDPGNRWLRRQLLEVAGELKRGPARHQSG